MLFFMNALFQGSVQEWLGREAMRVLAEGDRQGLVRRLSDDFSQLSRLSAEPQSGEWRMAILPLLDENSLQQIRLYIRQLEGDGADGRDARRHAFRGRGVAQPDRRCCNWTGSCARPGST